MVPACDISKYQGAWQNYPCDIVMIKMSGGDAGLYFDPDAATNYKDAVAAGKAVGGYHFIGWTMGAVQEATWFLKAMSPLAENDVLALDVESGSVAVSDSSPAYTLQMVNYIHDQCGVWPLVYMSLSTLNAYDWSAVLQNCGLWLADWNGNPGGTISTKYTYVMQQYSDGPVYDHDEWFGTVAAFQKYGYHAPVVDTTPAPVVTPTTPAPVETPTPVTTPDPIVVIPPTTPEPVEPTTPTTPIKKPTPVASPQPVIVTVEKDVEGWFAKLVKWLRS